MDVVRLQGPRGQIRFEDSLEHFEHGVLRLLGVGRDAFEHWLAVAETEPAEELLERLGRAFRRLSPMARGSTLSTGRVAPGPGGLPGSLWHTSIADHRAFGVARADDGSIGWLVQEQEETWARVLEPPTAEEIRLASLRAMHDDKLSPSQWRREKAARLVAELSEIAGVSSGRVLEVGAVADDFRYALDDAGLVHDGIGVAAARQTCDLIAEREPGYAAVTFWDSLGRDPDPVGLLRAARGCLLSRGVVAIKTPNIRCPEARMFGPHFHSFRRENLVYFTPESLIRICEEAGFTLLHVTTVSHLLVGFVGADACAELAAQKRGSDLIGYFRRAD
jgi:hypothetical protein